TASEAPKRSRFPGPRGSVRGLPRAPRSCLDPTGRRGDFDMICPRCKVETGADARFCEECGARLETACPGCGAPVTPGKKFCRSCGAPLTTEPGPFAAPASYTPKHLAERILTSKT